jgi:L-rhamnose mutarotase
MLQMIDIEKMNWFISEYNSYNPLVCTLINIKKNITNYSIELIIDLECKDVRFLIPRLIKVLHQCGKQEYQVHLVDMKKLPLKVVGLNEIIYKVPTIVVKEKEKEIFRIVEKTTNSVEIEKELELGLKNIQLKI